MADNKSVLVKEQQSVNVFIADGNNNKYIES